MVRALSTDVRHGLNAICPYFTMFPLEYPMGILLGSKAKRVVDPFCGRGTTLYAARHLGLESWGIDASQIAVAVAQAKLADAAPACALTLARELIHRRARQIPMGEFWRWAYHPQTLRQLCSLREGLLTKRSEAAALLRAVCLGALHGPRQKTFPSYFSNQFPRTFAPKPDYSIKFLKARGLHPQRVDVLDVLERRLERLSHTIPIPGTSSRQVVQGNSTQPRTFASIPEEVDRFITSPPYYGMNTYVQDQWLRNWFVGGTPAIDYVNSNQISHRSPDRFLSDMALVWANCARKAASKARLHVRFGGIASRGIEARELMSASLQASGCWRLVEVRTAESASAGKRQADQMGSGQGHPIVEHDYTAVLRW